MSEINKKKPGFFEDDQGNPSSMRLLSALSFVIAVVFGYFTLKVASTHIDAGLYLTTIFALGAFAPKAVQKFAETKVMI